MLCEHEEEKKKVMDWRVEELKGLGQNLKEFVGLLLVDVRFRLFPTIIMAGV